MVECIHCKQCVHACPMNAIDANGITTSFRECITCRTCVDVCPIRGTIFSFSRKEALSSIPSAKIELPSRRAFVGATGLGLAFAGMQYSNVYGLMGKKEQGTLWPDKLIRPPGSIPENEFLSRCIRCG